MPSTFSAPFARVSLEGTTQIGGRFRPMGQRKLIEPSVLYAVSLLDEAVSRLKVSFLYRAPVRIDGRVHLCALKMSHTFRGLSPLVYDMKTIGVPEGFLAPSRNNWHFYSLKVRTRDDRVYKVFRDDKMSFEPMILSDKIYPVAVGPRLDQPVDPLVFPALLRARSPMGALLLGGRDLRGRAGAEPL